MVTSGLSGRIDQRRIPGLSRIYGDFLYDFERVQRFYPGGRPLDLDRLAAAARAQAYPAERRQMVAGLLERQNRGWAPGGELAPAAAQNLQRLAAADGVVVITGQQVGLGGGPLLTLFKAMTTVLVAERLQARGVNAAPMFWMATQDHDREEVDHFWGLDQEGAPQRLQASLDGEEESPVGPRRLGDDIADLMAVLERHGNAKGVEALRACYRPGATLAQAFGELYARWFAPWGLLLFDPLAAPEAAAVWQPYYRAALERQPELAARLQTRREELEAAGYHAQVEQTAAAAMVFFHRDGRRRGVRRLGDGEQDWRVGEETVTRAEALRWVDEHPEQVSPAALLRPLLQDALLPTVAHVTGPAETAYLAQSATLFEALETAAPVVWPRVSATVVDRKAERLLQKYELTLDEIWSEPVEELLARRLLPGELERQVQRMRQGFDQEFGALTRGLQQLDPTLVDATQGARQKIHYQLEQLEARVARSFARRSAEVTSQARHLAGTLYPRQGLQERRLGGAEWMVRHPQLLQRVHQQADPELADHQMIAV